MKKSSQISIYLFILLLLIPSKSQGDPRSHIINLACYHQLINNQTISIPNFLDTMTKVGTQLRSSHSGTSVTGTSPDSIYGLAECYGDLSAEDCVLCYAEARTVLPTCFPANGGRIFLDGCFMRIQNYSFYEEYVGSDDRVYCGDTMMGGGFQDSVRNAVSNAVMDAPRNSDYFAQELAVSGTANESAFVLADCWNTLNEDSCTECLERASASILQCLPYSEGRALYTGCFLRYSNTNFLNPEPSQGNNGGKTMAIVMAVSSVVAFVVVGIIAFCAKKHRSKSKRRQGSDDTNLLNILNSSSLNFKYSMIEKATSSFDEANKLGQGGFGTVYKGVLPNGVEIAAKRLFVNHQHRAGDFYNEVNIISSVEHKNLVKLVGFSCLGPESVLIYEYLPNRSLDHFIFDAVRGKELNWAKRFDIIVGTAEGLAYLHENSKTRIIHRDIKAANILLDSKLRAKIADFGLARSFQQDKNHISTGIAGTLGYMAPEYISHGHLTEKADVYSFGVLLLEVVTGMQNRGTQTAEYTHNLVSIVWKHFKEGTVEEVFDPNMMLSDDNVKKEVEKVVQIGLLCTQEVPSLRPTMSMALQMLSKNIHPLPFPSNPAFLPESPNDFGSVQASRRKISIPASVPTVSLTSLGPR
ncbi:cysteine-rich receptor-like protein kinase 2 [Cynara cardunculus var. scolymus]|uniref:cysteine-rich receptor-like protein kinase 2 n=1 Tax=Cynara cardunculus var. scolymus TaxID=59895 RepID=UPI000D624829|nr:cysteine-rich receptor-like protein kinase 2 [Cynara cardunculus var. scolymus]